MIHGGPFLRSCHLTKLKLEALADIYQSSSNEALQGRMHWWDWNNDASSKWVRETRYRSGERFIRTENSCQVGILESDSWIVGLLDWEL